MAASSSLATRRKRIKPPIRMTTFPGSGNQRKVDLHSTGMTPGDNDLDDMPAMKMPGKRRGRRKS